MPTASNALGGSYGLAAILDRTVHGVEETWMPNTSSDPELAGRMADKFRFFVKRGLDEASAAGADGAAIEMDLVNEERFAAPGQDVLLHALGIVARELVELGYRDLKLQAAREWEDKGHRIAIGVPIPKPHEVEGYLAMPPIDVRSSQMLSYEFEHKRTAYDNRPASYLWGHNFASGNGPDVGWTRTYHRVVGNFDTDIPERSAAIEAAHDRIREHIPILPGDVHGYHAAHARTEAWNRFRGEGAVVWPMKTDAAGEPQVEMINAKTLKPWQVLGS